MVWADPGMLSCFLIKKLKIGFDDCRRASFLVIALVLAIAVGHANIAISFCSPLGGGGFGSFHIASLEDGDSS